MQYIKINLLEIYEEKKKKEALLLNKGIYNLKHLLCYM
jgi:hypothetical protein